MRSNISKLKGKDSRYFFQLKLSNSLINLYSLFIEDEEQEKDEEIDQECQAGNEQVEEQWRMIKNAYVETCVVLGRERKEERKVKCGCQRRLGRK